MRFRYAIAYSGGVLVVAVLVVLFGLLYQQRVIINQSEQSEHAQVPIIKDSEEFARVEASPRAVLKFHAQWCSSCRAMEAPFARIAEKLKQKIDFFVIDVTDQQRMSAIAKEYSIVGVPVFLFLKQGKEIHKEKRILGEVDESELYNTIINVFGIEQQPSEKHK